MTNKTLCVTHNADLDGHASQAIARRALGDSATYLGWDYNLPVPDLSSYDSVYLIDISLPKEVMVANSTKITWLDHHISKIRELDGVPIWGNRIDGVAACRLAWQWFNGDKNATKADFVDRKVKEPRAITWLGEHDIFNHTDPDTWPFQYAMMGLKSPPWDALLGDAGDPEQDETIARLLDNGRAIQGFVDTTSAEIALKSAYSVSWEGLNLIALNTATKGSAQFDAAVKPEHDGCLKYSYNGTAWDCSLYSVAGKDIDLSQIAVKHGGGGHRGAAGFRLKTLPKELGGSAPEIMATYRLNPVHPDPEKLPDKLDVGRRIRVAVGSWTGWTGVVAQHYINCDDCAGNFGRAEYYVKNDATHEHFSISPTHCEFL